MKKLLLLVLLVALLAAVLAACGAPATEAPAPTSAPKATEAPTKAPEPTKAPTATEAPAPTAAAPTAEPTAEPTEAPAPEPTMAPIGGDIISPTAYWDWPDLGGRTIRAVTGNDYVPLNFVDPKTGKAMGWEYDAMEEICQRLNCVIEWNVTAWDTMISAVHEGQFDVGMDGITITDERKQQVDFSIPYMRSEQFMLVRADEDRFSTPEEFAANPDLLIGSQAGTTNFYTAVYDVLDGDEQNPRIKLFETFGAAVQALLSGDVDMVLMDAASSQGYIGANPDQLKIVGDALASEDFGFIFTPGSDLVDPFRIAIATMKMDGYMDYLNKKWFYLTNPNGDDIYDAMPDLGGKTIQAVTGNDYVPLNFVDPKTGKAMGWEYDAVEEICQRINCTVNWNVTAWDTMISAVHEGQFDVGMDGITITDERKQQVDFSDPYMTSQQFMLVRADEDRFSTPEEFAADENLLIGSQAGTTNFYTAVYNVLDGDEQNPRIKLFETFGAAVQALLSGDVDMVLMDAASSKGYIGANPDKLKIVGGPLASEDFGFIFTPGSDLVQPFNQAIASMHEDGYFDFLNNRWFFLYDPGAAQ